MVLNYCSTCVWARIRLSWGHSHEGCRFVKEPSFVFSIKVYEQEGRTWRKSRARVLWNYGNTIIVNSYLKKHSKYCWNCSDHCAVFQDCTVWSSPRCWFCCFLDNTLLKYSEILSHWLQIRCLLVSWIIDFHFLECTDRVPLCTRSKIGP